MNRSLSAPASNQPFGRLGTLGRGPLKVKKEELSVPTDNNRTREPQPPRPRKRGKPLAAIGRGIAIAMMICIISGCIVASVMTVYVLNTLDQSDSVQLENVKLGFSTIIYAQDPATGEYVELQRVQSTENRIWVDYDEIPQSVKDAVVAVEDRRFWEHSGIDFKRTLAAAVNMFNPSADEVFGGSTITQQVVKNVTGDDGFAVGRKVREIFRAIDLEKNYSKEQILEAYLNIVGFSLNQNGVQSAANTYFGKDIADVTPAEAAAIIATTQNPFKYNPFRFPENNRQRQLWILTLMHEQPKADGTFMMTDAEYEAAVNQEMVFKEAEYVERTETIQNWFIDTLYEEVLDDLVNVAGYTKTGANEALQKGGFRIYTTVDVEMQEYLEQKYLDPETFPTIRNAEYPESAFVILDHQSGAIKAIVGSNREKTGARLFNRATDAVRHPGSTIKPLTAYAPALEDDYIYWSMVWDDNPILLNPSDPTSLYPKNFYVNPPYRGPITITEAVQRSTNTIPVKIVQMISPRTSFNFLRDSLEFKNLIESQVINGRVFSDIDLAPMALGAMTGGVTPLEMAAGYQMFGNGGLFYKPHSYTVVLDSNGNVVLENKAVPKRVISVETATIMNKLLQRVTNSAPGTGTPAKFSAMPIAGKTGTSSDDKDQWFIGVTPYYVGVCWLGYDVSETINYRGYYYPPPIIWKNVMAPIHADLPVVEFPTDGNVVQRQYCMQSGKTTNTFCTERAVGWFKMSNIPPICDGHDLDGDGVVDENGDPIVDQEHEPGGNVGGTPQNGEYDPSDPLSYWRWLYGTDDEDGGENN